MSDFIYQGNIRAFFLTAISDSGFAPTVAEIDAGVELTGNIRAFGGFDFKTNRVQTPKADSRFVRQINGTQVSSDSSLTIYTDSVTNPLRTTLAQDVEGFIVFADYKPTGDLVAGDLVDVFPVSVSGRPKRRVLGDDAADWMAEFSIREVPAEDTAVLA